MTEIMQGEAFSLFALVTDDGGAAPTEDDVVLLEVMIGQIRKVYPGQITYDAASKQFEIPLTQADTLSLAPGMTDAQARCKFSDSTVLGWHRCAELCVTASASREIL